MVDQLSAFASEVTKVALEVGTRVYGEVKQKLKVYRERGLNWPGTSTYVPSFYFFFFDWCWITDLLLTENGFEFDWSSAIHFRSYQGRCAWWSWQAWCSRRDAWLEDEHVLSWAGWPIKSLELVWKSARKVFGWTGVCTWCPVNVEGV